MEDLEKILVDAQALVTNIQQLVNTPVPAANQETEVKVEHEDGEETIFEPKVETIPSEPSSTTE